MIQSNHKHLLEWWADDDLDHGRPSVNNPDVRRLVANISPGSQVEDLGGTMSLNLKLDPAGGVLRVHQPFVSKGRILAVQAVRRQLSNFGLIVPTAIQWGNSTVFRCGNRWAELEKFIPHHRDKPSLNSYTRMFTAMGALHRILTTLDLTVPRPLVATWATPTTLNGWLSVTESAVQGDSEAMDNVQLLRDLIKRLRSQWIPATKLPKHLVHGDIRLSNICRTAEGMTVYLDFGFIAHRPRIHDLSYSIAFILLAANTHQYPEDIIWRNIPKFIEAYEDAANSRITVDERRALLPYTAAVPLYHVASDGFKADPINSVKQRMHFLRLSEWLLTHSEVML